MTLEVQGRYHDACGRSTESEFKPLGVSDAAAKTWSRLLLQAEESDSGVYLEVAVSSKSIGISDMRVDDITLRPSGYGLELRSLWACLSQ